MATRTDAHGAGRDSPTALAERLVEMGEMVFVSWALQVVATLGVADRMSETPRPADAIAADCGADPDGLRRVLRLLAMHGVVHEAAPGQFALTPLGACLGTGSPVSVRSWFVMNGPIYRTLFDAPLHSVQTGRPAFAAVLGASFFDYAAVDPEWGAVFDAAMGDIGRRTAAAVVRAYDFRSFERIVDVGGGTGTLISAILEAAPNARGTIFDLAPVAGRARAAIEAVGLAARCDVVTGDFFEAVPPGADAYVLSWVIHDWDDDEAAAILANCRHAMSSGGRVLLVESAMPDGDEPHLAKSMDIAMLVALGGRERTVPEYRSLLHRAGLQLTRVIPADSAMSIFEAVLMPA
jgi:SAM-dependent methyltransferase